MITFKIKSKNWTCDAPTIEKYYAIQDWLLTEDNVANWCKIIQTLSGAPEEELRALPLPEIEAIWSGILHGPLSSRHDSFSREWEWDGVRYGFIDTTSITVGEMADMDTLKAHPQASKQLHKMMAILWRPIKSDSDSEIEEYGVKGFDARAEIFLTKMPIQIVLRLISFFLLGAKTSLGNMMDSLDLTTRSNHPSPSPKKTVRERILRLLVVGLSSCIFLPIMIYWLLKGSLKLVSLLLLTIWRFVRTKPRGNVLNRNNKKIL